MFLSKKNIDVCIKYRICLKKCINLLHTIFSKILEIGGKILIDL